MTRPLFSDLLRHLRRAAGAAQAAGLEDFQLLERFIAEHDEAAFALLLHRHGPMVLGVCQRLLPNPHDCEDAFQATFLVLLRKARSLRRRELLANWLYGVAHRTALKARCRSAHRHVHERELGDIPAAIDASAEVNRRDLRAVLEEEVNRLPAKYRVPVILCYLEGKTFAEAAVQLGWPAGTVSGRLARARDLLRKRLKRRDVTLAAGWEALMLQPAGPAQVSTVLINSSLKSATSLMAGSATGAAVISGPVAVLTEGVLTAMFLTKIKILVAVVGIGLTVTGSGVLVSAKMAGQSPNKQEEQSRSPAPAFAVAKNSGSRLDQTKKSRDKKVSPMNEKATPDDYQARDQKLPYPGLNYKRAKAALEKSRQPENLKPIVRSLFEEANVELDARWKQFHAGQGTLDILCGSSLRLLEAEKQLSKDKADHLLALEHHLKRMQEIEKLNQERFDAGRIAIGDLAQSRYFRIQAELWFEQARAK
jgi:RNA polymerase sigma factor (sigma-70 family)